MHLTYVSTNTTDPYQSHRIVKSIFTSCRPLFINMNGMLKVISEKPANANTAFDGSKVVSTRPPTIPEAGTPAMFRITFNPVASKRTAPNESTKVGIGNPGMAKEWLVRQMNQHGAEVVTCEIMQSGVDRIMKDDAVHATAVRHTVVGLVTISDPSKFSSLLLHGLGKTKFAGYGMIDIWM